MTNENQVETQTITVEMIEAADRKGLDAMAAEMEIDVAPRTRIDDLRATLIKAITGEQSAADVPAPHENPDPSPEAREQRRLDAKNSRADRSEKRRLRHKKTGRIFVYSRNLAKLADLELVQD